MLKKTDSSAIGFVIAALLFFFIGGILTTVVPPIVDKSWSKPFENSDPAKGPTGKLVAYTDQQLKGRAIYVREGCWYCHTQQTRTILADTVRSGWKGVRSPVSTPDEFVYDKTPTCSAPSVPVRTCRAWAANTIRSGIGRTSVIRATWCPARSCRRSPGSLSNEEEFTALVAYLQTLGRAKNWRPDNDYEK